MELLARTPVVDEASENARDGRFSQFDFVRQFSKELRTVRAQCVAYPEAVVIPDYTKATLEKGYRFEAFFE